MTNWKLPLSWAIENFSWFNWGKLQLIWMSKTSVDFIEKNFIWFDWLNWKLQWTFCRRLRSRLFRAGPIHLAWSNPGLKWFHYNRTFFAAPPPLSFYHLIAGEQKGDGKAFCSVSPLASSSSCTSIHLDAHSHAHSSDASHFLKLLSLKSECGCHTLHSLLLFESRDCSGSVLSNLD